MEFRLSNQALALPDFFTQDEIRRFFLTFSENDPTALERKAFFEGLYSAGLRMTEAISLKWENIDLENQVLFIFSKNGRERLVPYGHVLAELLVRLRRERRNIYGSDFVFFGLRAESGQSGLRRILKLHLNKAGITRNVTWHTLRYSFATHLLQSKADLRAIQDLLGHMDISTSQIYAQLTRHKAQPDVEEVRPIFKPTIQFFFPKRYREVMIGDLFEMENHMLKSGTKSWVIKLVMWTRILQLLWSSLKLSLKDHF